ncbi:MAG: MFS transporter [Spirochaetes bacterium]|nr:MFS transporter [Spirochaetota bacterium]
MGFTLFITYSAILVLSVNSQIFPSILSQINESSFMQGILLAFLFLLFPFTAAGIGMVTDRVGKRPVLVAGSLLLGVPFLISAFVSSFWIRTFVVILFGIGMGIVEGQASALLSDSFPGRERSIMNVSQTFFSIGAAGGPFLIVVLYRVFPGMKIFWILFSAGLAGIVLAAGFLFLKTNQAVTSAARKVNIRELLSDRSWKFLAVSLFVYVAAEMGTVSWLAKYGTDLLGLTAGTAPLCIALFWAGLGLSRFLVGSALHGIKSRSILIFSFLFTLTFQILTFSTLKLWIVLPSILFMGIGMGPVWPTLVSVAGTRYSGSNGFAVGTLIAVGGIAVSLVQPLIGILSKQSVLGLRLTMLSLSLLTIYNLIRTGFLKSKVEIF